MKTNANSKANLPAGEAAGFRTGGVRASSVKAQEHRYERRKIREQLRRLDWALNDEN